MENLLAKTILNIIPDYIFYSGDGFIDLYTDKKKNSKIIETALKECNIEYTIGYYENITPETEIAIFYQIDKKWHKIIDRLNVMQSKEEYINYIKLNKDSSIYKMEYNYTYLNQCISQRLIEKIAIKIIENMPESHIIGYSIELIEKHLIEDILDDINENIGTYYKLFERRIKLQELKKPLKASKIQNLQLENN